jgi:hypothetical protein
MFCLAGSQTPQAVSTGFYSSGGISEQTRDSQTRCPQGTYCVGGIRRACPAGRFGSSTGLSSSLCSGPCREGFFCPDGSVSATERLCSSPATYCPAGSGSPRALLEGAGSGPAALSGRAEFSTGSAADADAASGAVLVATPVPQSEAVAPPNSSESVNGSIQEDPRFPQRVDETQLSATVRSAASLCPAGFVCPPGSSGARIPCPAGKFGAATGASSLEHCHTCSMGHYCPLGSISPKQVECGAVDVFCTAGAQAPTRSDPGFFTAGGGPRTRSVQVRCPAGSFCPGDGRAQLCRPGSYAPTAGLAACRPCAAGFWCGEGSVTPTQHDCGAASLFCPPGSPRPINATAGYFTLRVEPAAAPAALVAASAFAAPLFLDADKAAAGRWGAADERLAVGLPGGSVDATVAARVRARMLRAVTSSRLSAALPSAALPWNWARRLSTDSLHGRAFWLVPPLAASIAAVDSGLGAAIQHPQAASAHGPSTAFVTVTPSLAVLQALQTQSLSRWTEVLGRAAPQHLHPELALPRGSSAFAYSASLQPAGTLVAAAGAGNVTACGNLTGVALMACQSPPGPTLLTPTSSPDSHANPPLALLAGITSDTSLYRTHERRCDMGHFCPGDGTRSPCPAGTFGNATGLESVDQCLPCVEGFFCPEASVTGRDEPCGNVDVFCPASASSPTPVAAGHYTRLGNTTTRSSQRLCPTGYFCSGGVKTECPAGRYGSLAGETRADCQGPCTAGYFCPAASTSSTHVRCGAATVFCPAGSATPQGVRAGWYTVGGRTTASGGAQSDSQPLDCKQSLPPALHSAGAQAALRGPLDLANFQFDEARRCTSAVIGDADTRTGQVSCPAGSFCAAGWRYGCPPGRFGSKKQEIAPFCEGDCAAGFYCPWSSVRPDQVVCGSVTRFCPSRSGAPTPVTPGAQSDADEPPERRTRELPCPRGYYCGPDAIARPCRAGSFGARLNETSPDCSGICSQGYYCKAASTSPTQFACGNTSVYCPAGSATPQLAPPGTYTAGSHPLATAPSAGKELVLDPFNSTRSSTLLCPAGHYCSGGVLRQCPAGVIGNSTGQSSSSCDRSCPMGFFCPPGTVSDPFECGAVFDNSSLAALVITRGLNFSELFEPYAAATRGGLAVGPTALGGTEGAKRLAALVAAGADAGLEAIAWESGARGTLPQFEADIRSAASEHSLPVKVGPTSVFCPQGSGWPTAVAAGSFTAGSASSDPDTSRNATRTAQHPCPVGTFCVAGLQMPCPPGRFGTRESLEHWTCTGLCPPGFACPLGTAEPEPCQPGTYATGGNHKCIACPTAAGAGSALARALGDRFAAARPVGDSGQQCVTSAACCGAA